MKDTTILVIGATGKTGMSVAEQAIQAGLKVRAVIRREDERSARLRQAGAETVYGNVHDMKSVRNLVAGIERIYFAYPPQLDRLVEVTSNIAIAAKDAGVSALINLSQITARESAPSRLSHHHWLSEFVFDQAGIGAIHLRPGFFAENLVLFNSSTIASEGKIYLPYGDRGHAPIAAADIAGVAVELLIRPEPYLGKKLVLTGPKIFTIREMANIIGGAIGRPIEYVDLPADQWRRILIHQVGLPDFLADHLYQVSGDHRDGIFEKHTDTVERITGVAPQPLPEFVRENRAKFTGHEVVSLGV